MKIIRINKMDKIAQGRSEYIYWLTPDNQIYPLNYGEIHRDAIPRLVRQYKLGDEKEYLSNRFMKFFKAGFIRLYIGRDLNIELSISSANESQKQKLMELAKGKDIHVDDVDRDKTYFSLKSDELFELLSGKEIRKKRQANSENIIKSAQWYKKEEPIIPKPYKITKVVQDRNEDIESLKGIYYIDQTPYGALKKFLKRYPFLYDYEEAGITLMTVVDEEKLPEVQEKYRRKIEEKQRIKDKEISEKTKNLWYMQD